MLQPIMLDASLVLWSDLQCESMAACTRSSVLAIDVVVAHFVRAAMPELVTMVCPNVPRSALQGAFWSAASM